MVLGSAQPAAAGCAAAASLLLGGGSARSMHETRCPGPQAFTLDTAQSTLPVLQRARALAWAAARPRPPHHPLPGARAARAHRFAPWRAFGASWCAALGARGAARPHPQLPPPLVLLPGRQEPLPGVTNP